MTSLRVPGVETEYGAVLDILESGAFWKRGWAAGQYVGLVLTAMCTAVIGDSLSARRYAVLRVMEVFLEHRHDLLPYHDNDLNSPRDRVAHLAIPGAEVDCDKWIDILEYMQLKNWQRKGIVQRPDRLETLRDQIADNFSPELMGEVDELPLGWWIT